MGEPGGLPSVGSHTVGHDWSDLAAAATIPKADLKVHTYKRCLKRYFADDLLNSQEMCHLQTLKQKYPFKGKWKMFIILHSTYAEK